MLAKDTGHSIYRNIKSFGGVERVPCEVVKQREIWSVLRSVQSVLETIVSTRTLSK